MTFVLYMVKCVFLLPALAFTPPLPLLFIAAAIGGGILLAHATITLLNVTNALSGAVVSRISAPLRGWALFIIWAMIDIGGTAAMLGRPFIMAGILFSMLLGTAGIWTMRRCPVSMRAVILLLPAIASATSHGVLLKFAVNMVPDPGAALGYAGISSLVTLITCGLWMAKQGKLTDLKDKSLILPGLLIGLSDTFVTGTRFIAFIDAPNPGYIYIITLLIAVWVYLWNRLRGIKDGSDARAGFVLVLSTAMLIYFTSL
jgi:hypothetical protein